MPTRHFSVLEDHIYPTDFFPFATAQTRDPASGVEASVLDKARALGAVPKLFYVNNSSEYWNRAASLPTTDPAGARDVAPAPQARVYLIAGAQHMRTGENTVADLPGPYEAVPPFYVKAFPEYLRALRP